MVTYLLLHIRKQPISAPAPPQQNQDRGAVEKVPLNLYNLNIIVNRFQGWRYIYVGHTKTLAGRPVCG
jgi:hypothetical protein